ncbi:MAG TPA: YMGG-like glycine zipper-containing protein [Gemmatimonadaceae bacterium]|nr:YMGG-like glycine zipper-containing protein [Gemmatimonadaceae bacterium]
MKRNSGLCAFVALAVFALAACSDNGDRNDVLAQDTSLTRDLALANQDTASKPALQDVPVVTVPEPVEPEAIPAAAPAPTRRRQATPPPPPPRSMRRRVVTRPAPADPEQPSVRVTESGNTERVSPRGSEHEVGVVSAGSEISLAAGQRICTNTNAVGDRFTAQISDPVMGANGTVIPAGATATVSVSSLARSNRTGETIEIGLRVESISFAGKTYLVTSETTYAEVDRVRAESRGDDVKKVATGAAIGAVLGQILGGRTKSTVIGAATGAAAGAVVASRNANYDGCIPSGGRITIRLTEPLTIQLTE